MKWIDRITESWAAEHPNRDFSSLPPLVRLGRISLLMQEYQKRVLKPVGLTPSDYTILGALRRAGQPRQLRPGDLYNAVGCSPGGLTKMIDRLEKRGLVERLADADDARCFHIRLTTDGEELERRGFAAYVHGGGRLMEPLSKQELADVDSALELLLGCFEPPIEDAYDELTSQSNANGSAKRAIG